MKRGKKPKRPQRAVRGSVANCEACQKWMYSDRKTAKAAAAKMHDRLLREYRCLHNSRYWHVGHLPQATVRGRKTAAEVYRKVEVPDA